MCLCGLYLLRMVSVCFYGLRKFAHGVCKLLVWLLYLRIVFRRFYMVCLSVCAVGVGGCVWCVSMCLCMVILCVCVLVVYVFVYGVVELRVALCPCCLWFCKSLCMVCVSGCTVCIRCCVGCVFVCVFGLRRFMFFLCVVYGLFRCA